MKNLGIEYSAGFFEGDGSISIHRHCQISNSNRKRYLRYCLVVTVAQSGSRGKNICTLFEKTFEGRAYDVTGRRSKKTWRWICNSQQAYKFLVQVYPYMQIKRKQVGLAFDFQKRLKNPGEVYKSVEERIIELGYQETLKQEIGFLNRE